MAEIDLTQAEAEALIKMEKHCNSEEHYNFPMNGEYLVMPLQSPDKREEFLLDIYRGKINFSKVTYQNRARKVIILIRLDIFGPNHRNPDDEEIACPHIHIYKEGFSDKWAFPIPTGIFVNLDDIWQTLEDFMRYCNITKKPYITRGLFI